MKLDYARRVEPAARTSRLAVFALVGELLGCPCISWPMLSWACRRWDVLELELMLIVWLVVMGLLPVMGVVRVAVSRGRRTGYGFACAGFVLALIWWGMAIGMRSIW